MQRHSFLIHICRGMTGDLAVWRMSRRQVTRGIRVVKRWDVGLGPKRWNARCTARTCHTRRRSEGSGIREVGSIIRLATVIVEMPLRVASSILKHLTYWCAARFYRTGLSVTSHVTLC